ncbi:MAG: PKD domain-containing protein, partial [Gammaproteobacteria bacterium]|nr:PKD domain-containing protein [Gammaproteobacteria bacterium]
TVGTAITFDGTGSTDSDGIIETYEWTFGDMGTGTGATTTYTYAAPGTYMVTLTVTDDLGLTNQANVTITISAGTNLPPVAVITAPPTTGTTGTAVTFNGANSTDADGTVETYAWDFGDGGTGTGAIASYAYTTAGTYTVALTVTDNTGDTNEATTSIIISAGANQPPVAMINAPTTGTVNTAITFDGTGSTDADGNIASYAWDFGDGGTDVGATATYAYTTAGTYTVTLTVTDDAGDTNAATASITISAGANQPPVAVITAPPTTGTTGTPVTFNGANSTDADGTIATYAWDFGDTNMGTGATATHTYTTAGTYTVTLTVTDDAGDMNAATTSITISAGANQPPVAVITAPTAGTVGTEVTFDGTGSTDADGTISTYAWDFGDTNMGTGATATHTYMAAGAYTVTLTVTDDAGDTNTATTTITVSTAANQLPVAMITGPTTGTANIELTFDGSGSTDVDGNIATYGWDFGDTVTDTGATALHTYKEAGTYTITLLVTDNAGGTNSTTASIVIDPAANQPPVAIISGPTTGTAGMMITFSGAGSTDRDGTIASYAWDLGEGTTGTLVDITSSFAVGTYTITLTVTDDMGVTGSTTANIVITAAGAPQPPVADAGGPYTGVVGTAVLFDGSGSMDPDGTIAMYQWDFGDSITGAVMNPTHTFTAAGTFTITLTVTDNDGMTGSSTTTAVIDPAPAPPTPPAPSTMGEQLYIANCERCHGANGVGGRDGDVVGESASDTKEAIEEESAMSSLSVLTDEEIMLITAFLAENQMGAQLYSADCESCHGPGGTGGTAEEVVGESAEDIAEAIDEEPTMNSLSVLSEEEIEMIADYLESYELDAVESDSIPAEETLYITFCASCHGAGGTGGAAAPVIDASFVDVKDAISRVTTMRAQVNIVSDQYIADIVKFLDQPNPNNGGGGNIDKPTGNNAVGDGGGGSLLWLIGLVTGAWVVTRRRR